MCSDVAISSPMPRAIKRIFKPRRVRLDSRTKQALKAIELRRAYTKRLGNTSRDPLIKENIQRLAELESLAWIMRGDVLSRRSTDVYSLDKLERFCARLRRQLKLDGPPQKLKRKRDMSDIVAEALTHG
jgi:hypothetical protein